MDSMNRLSTQQRSQIISCLVDGNSIRATCRITGTAKGTVLRLLREVGIACAEYQDEVLRNLPCERLQCDEIWSFCYAKAKNVPEERKGDFGYGDVWTWTAICADTKLIPAWHISSRDAHAAHRFMMDLSGRLSNPVQITTDGHKAYMEAVNFAFIKPIDYAMLVKLYGSARRETQAQTRYSPAQCVGTEVRVIQGNPDPKHISTSYVERQNLTMRMGLRRFTRLTNAFSKKIENHACAVALHFMYYNFARPHQSLKGKSPAMAAGVADHVWSTNEIAQLLESN